MTEKTNTIYVNLILDESGSMSCCKQETINGFNEYIQSLKKQNVEFTLTKFNSKVNIVYDDKPISEVKPLTAKDYNPDNLTALYDAIGETVNKVKEKKSKVLIVILTDGEENQSTEFNQEAIKKLIKKKEGEGWTFVYLGANQDAVLSAEKFGLKCNAMSFSTSNMKGTMATLSDSTKTFCKAGGQASRKFFK